jgi:hypothetical protein
MQLGCPTVHGAVRSYFDDRHPVGLIMMTTGASQLYHNFINDNINLPHYFMATCFDHITVIIRPNIRAKMYVF